MDLQPQQPASINPKNTTEVACEKCAGTVFETAYFIRKASKILTGAAKDAYIPVNTFLCKSCGHINKEFLPNF